MVGSKSRGAVDGVGGGILPRPLIRARRRPACDASRLKSSHATLHQVRRIQPDRVPGITPARAAGARDSPWRPPDSPKNHGAIRTGGKGGKSPEKDVQAKSGGDVRRPLHECRILAYSIPMRILLPSMSASLYSMHALENSIFLTLTRNASSDDLSSSMPCDSSSRSRTDATSSTSVGL